MRTVRFFDPLKFAYSTECDNRMATHPGKVMRPLQVAGFFNSVYAVLLISK